MLGAVVTPAQRPLAAAGGTTGFSVVSAGPAAGRQLRGQAGGELAEELVTHLSQHPLAELGLAAGHVHRGLYGHPGLAVLVPQPGADGGRGRATAPHLLARRLQRDRPGLLVPLGEARRAGVGEGDGADLDLEPAGHHVARHRVDGGARQAGRHLFDVE